ncbi:MAG: hypothetical protein AAGC60_17570 [Acidobacteriota bacterium]
MTVHGIEADPGERHTARRELGLSFDVARELQRAFDRPVQQRPADTKMVGLPMCLSQLAADLSFPELCRVKTARHEEEMLESALAGPHFEAAGCFAWWWFIAGEIGECAASEFEQRRLAGPQRS